MERLSSIVQVRRRSVLADAKRGSLVHVVHVGEARDSDVKALDDEIATLSDRIQKLAEAGTEGAAALFASYVVFKTEWREWLTNEGYDEDLKMPWYRSSTLGPKGEKAFDDFKSRNVSFGKRYAKLKYPGLPADLPSDYGAPLSPAEGGSTEPTGSGPARPGGLSPKPPTPPSSSLLSSITNTITNAPVPLLVLVVATVAAVGGYFLLTKLTTKVV